MAEIENRSNILKKIIIIFFLYRPALLLPLQTESKLRLKFGYLVRLNNRNCTIKCILKSTELNNMFFNDIVVIGEETDISPRKQC